ncbi:MAG: hypothetical protein U1E94_05380 [Agitococcus sp.]
MATIIVSKQGIATADNNKYFKYWHEDRNCYTNKEEYGRKWLPYHKGGDLENGMEILSLLLIGIDGKKL